MVNTVISLLEKVDRSKEKVKLVMDVTAIPGKCYLPAS